MIHANPGNLLKFTKGTAWQRHRQPGQDRHAFGLKCPKDKILPFQLYFTDGAGAITWRLVSATDPSYSVAMTVGDLAVDTESGGDFWITWLGTTALTTSIDCGYYWIEVTVSGVAYSSEVIYAYDPATEPTPIWRFKFTNTTDKGTVLYQVGSGGAAYVQYLYVTKWAWDRPEVERDLNILVDGNGKEIIRGSRTVAKFRLEAADLPDYAIPFLAKVGDLDTVYFEQTTGSINVQMVNTAFEARVQGTPLNVGVFKFDAEEESFNGCQENFELV